MTGADVTRRHCLYASPSLLMSGANDTASFFLVADIFVLRVADGLGPT